MGNPATFASFEKELNRLVMAFEKNFAHFTSTGYDEATLRQQFLNPLFAALGYDMENRAGLIADKCEVEIESRTEISGRTKRADYLFRTDGTNRFVCEAKKPREVLHDRYIYQAKRYAFNKNLPLAILTDFEELKVFIVGSRPYVDEPSVGHWQTWHYKQFPLVAKELWDLFARDNIAAGSIDKLLDSLPKRATIKGKLRQGWLIKPDRTLDAEFLNFLDEKRRLLAGDLLKRNQSATLLEDGKLNDAVQRILDRILFLRICEDRGIDTGTRLDSIFETWSRRTGHEELVRPKQQNLIQEPPSAYRYTGAAPRESLWWMLVRHFRALDARPPSHVPFFNGNLFKEHFSESLDVGDEFLAEFIQDISDEDCVYLFADIPVEILGSIYERFLGKVVRPHGKGVTIEEKPDVRKAGGVYYTPRYIVDYIVEQTVGKLIDGKSPKETAKLRFLDPACGSGSFLIGVYKRVMENYQQWFTDHPAEQKRALCYRDANGHIQLTVGLKRQILRDNIYGVDLDAQAVEVTQLSLYLKLLEHETAETLNKQRDLFAGEALLPALTDNIKNGNSLIASDFSMIPEDLIRVHAFDWDIQFPTIMKAGGFDAVVGNPPYGRLLDAEGEAYMNEQLPGFLSVHDVYVAFIHKGISLLRTKGRIAFIVPSAWLGGVNYRKMREKLLNYSIEEIICLPFDVFRDAYIDTLTFAISKFAPSEAHAVVRCFTYPKKTKLKEIAITNDKYERVPVSIWRASPDNKFVMSAGAAALLQRLQMTHSTRITDYVEIKRGVRFDLSMLTQRKSGPDSYRYFEGDVYRYEINMACQNWIEFGPKMYEYPKEMKWFDQPRVLLRRLVNRQQRMMATFTDSTFISNKNLYSVLPRDGRDENGDLLLVILSVLNSKLISKLYLSQVTQATKDDFPQVTIADVYALPIPELLARDKKRLGQLSEKMSALMPQLRVAKTEEQRKTLQNAVTATDRQIDQLVYELYGLTAEEIQLVEGSN